MHDKLKDVETAEQLRACYPVMKELRPHLQTEEEFVMRVTRMNEQGYRILAAWEDGEVVALAGYRVEENLVYGKFLYVDDLVAGEKTRGQGWGARLLEHLTVYAEQAACAKLVLDTGMTNALAQRFYFRQGLLTGAMRFGKFLKAGAA
ncbi:MULTISPECIES: GNAT family N-acetyltransferase [unclassified Duganella]|uniref:GNAT family N-acetyltransferase n=1 Tax=unclassified Duganella TaxID=2636909 RepID=UPI000E349CB8|nr:MULTISPECIES: GNAT family N-acetyltransferase [unclassified Duganella]RFP12706.1 GNAT family N-acetyltransferase [Duganella sp. BJB475]RFP28682.1 GNAT family N-acetyltransferase [Duganella sp. BJB476]